MYYIIRQAKKNARYREREIEMREGEKESEIFNLLLVKLGKPVHLRNNEKNL